MLGEQVAADLTEAVRELRFQNDHRHRYYDLLTCKLCGSDLDWVQNEAGSFTLTADHCSIDCRAHR